MAWLPAQQHSSENIGATATRAIFVELKESVRGEPTPATDIGPADHPKVNA